MAGLLAAPILTSSSPPSHQAIISVPLCSAHLLYSPILPFANPVIKQAYPYALSQPKNHPSSKFNLMCQEIARHV
jgi:hypothetical protein